MQTAYEALEPLDPEQRGRAMQWLRAALDVTDLGGDAAPGAPAANGTQGPGEGGPPSSPPSPRAFIAQKKPKSAAERIACLAYYLTHYRGTPTFNTRALTDLNTDAAAPRFANPSRDVDNADRSSGFLVTAGERTKQLTVRGEALVVALPDREAVKQALEEHPHKRRRASGAAKKAAAES
ncbi:MAG TPA: hypothetical protein VK611_07490 [Acidimicrobiales bacterium]|nr:hypothetical protein [Acidimicrobiales bacterium]